MIDREETLVRQWQPLALAAVRDLYLPGADLDDLRQEALAGLVLALRSFDGTQGLLAGWIRLVVRSRVMSAVTMARREKHRTLTGAARDGVDEDGELCEIVDLLPSTVDVVELVEWRDTIRRVTAAMASLSEIERESLLHVVNGGTYANPGWPRNKRRENVVDRARGKLRRAAA